MGSRHQDTSDGFASIHDGYAYQKLEDYILGIITEKVATFMKRNAKTKAKELAQSSNSEDGLAL